MPSGRRASSRARLVLRIVSGRPRKSLAVECHDVEGVELHLGIVLARMQRIEVGDAIDAEHHRLTINDELPMAVLQCPPTIHG